MPTNVKQRYECDRFSGKDLAKDSMATEIENDKANNRFQKCHITTKYHCIQEVISTRFLYFLLINGKLNPSDNLIKFLNGNNF